MLSSAPTGVKLCWHQEVLVMKKTLVPSSDEAVDVTADADGQGVTEVVFAEDEWTEADAKAFIDELVARNQEALRGLAKL